MPDNDAITDHLATLKTNTFYQVGEEGDGKFLLIGHPFSSSLNRERDTNKYEFTYYLREKDSDLKSLADKLYSALTASEVFVSHRRAILERLGNVYGTEEVPDDILTDRDVFRKFIKSNFSNADDPVQAFLDTLRPELDNDNPIKTLNAESLKYKWKKEKGTFTVGKEAKETDLEKIKQLLADTSETGIPQPDEAQQKILKDSFRYDTSGLITDDKSKIYTTKRRDVSNTQTDHQLQIFHEVTYYEATPLPPELNKQYDNYLVSGTQRQAEPVKNPADVQTQVDAEAEAAEKQRKEKESFSVKFITRLIEPGKSTPPSRLDLTELQTNTPYYTGDGVYLTAEKSNRPAFGYNFDFYHYDNASNQWEKQKTFWITPTPKGTEVAKELSEYCNTLPLLRAVPTEALAASKANNDLYINFINALSRDTGLDIDEAGLPITSKQESLGFVKNKLAEVIPHTEAKIVDEEQPVREKPQLVLARDESGNLLAGIKTSASHPRTSETETMTEWYVFETHAEDSDRNKKWQPVTGGLALEKTLVDPEKKDDVERYISSFRSLSGVSLDDHKGRESIYDVMFHDQYMGDDKIGFKGDKEKDPNHDPESHLKASFMQQFNNPDWEFLKPPPSDIPDYKFEDNAVSVNINGSGGLSFKRENTANKEAVAFRAVTGATLLGAVGIGAYALLKNAKNQQKTSPNTPQENSGNQPAEAVGKVQHKEEKSSWVKRIGIPVALTAGAATLLALVAKSNNSGHSH